VNAIYLLDNIFLQSFVSDRWFWRIDIKDIYTIQTKHTLKFPVRFSKGLQLPEEELSRIV